MKLPRDAIIAESKISGYLLRPQARGDKSVFLAKAGFAIATADRLHEALSAMRGCVEVTVGDDTPFGRYLLAECVLIGPNGRALRVCTVWMTEHLSGETKFVTLIPIEVIRP